MGRELAILVIVMMGLGTLAGLPLIGEMGRMGGTVLETSGTAWTDSFEDQSDVYVPPGGLVGVEVAGGEVQLALSKNTGWVASSVITCPADLRYDRVMLDAVTPGNSAVLISILDPAVPPPGPWAANGTIDGFTNVTGKQLSLTSLSTAEHPSIRLQVTLVAQGSDRPRLLAWSVFYVDGDEWREDFQSTCKVGRMRQLAFTGGRAQLDLANMTLPPSEPDYGPFPPVFFPIGDNSATVPCFYPTADRTAYRAIAAIDGNGTNDVEFDDFDGDGNMDMVMANTFSGGEARESQIRWGTGSDPWSYASTTNVSIRGAEWVMSGDFNGDGEVDLSFAWYIYQNHGGGVFGELPEIWWIVPDAIGDLNNDGYEDIVSIGGSGAQVFNGSYKGPDPSSEEIITLPVDRISSAATHILGLDDINRDGYLDVLIPQAGYDHLIYLGGPDGPDTTIDRYLWCRQDSCNAFMTGDLNKDGYVDIVARATDTSGQWTLIYWGSRTGWSRAPDTELAGPTPYKVFDINKDGYDDILSYQSNISRFLVFFGSDSWDWVPDINKNAPMGTISDIVVAVPRARTPTVYTGSLVTEPIRLPEGKRWDLLNYDAVQPAGTDVFVSVLGPDDRSPSGMMMLTDRCVDLSGFEGIDSIRLRFTFRSATDTVTASINNVFVTWMDDMTWRDKFYSDFRAERLFRTEVRDGHLWTSIPDVGPQLVIPGLRRDGDMFGYTSVTSAFVDAGGRDYTSMPPMLFNTSGVEGASVADVNGDGYMDLALAVLARGDFDYDTNSPLYLGSPVGYNELAAHIFSTKGASDVLMHDLNDDGFTDIVFAQERNGTKYDVGSVLFWGSRSGWNSTPDIIFSTRGASGVEAADLDGDGRLDLAFACYKDSSTVTDSMVFLQGATGFSGTAPSHRLPTHGARAVAAGELNGDGLVDLVFANSVFNTNPRTDSYVYWGKAGGGFQATPMSLPTVGAEDVKVADLNGDGLGDVVFANMVDQQDAYGIDSYVYLNRPSTGLPQTPSARVPTMGAKAVGVADLDGTGYKDLVFACHYNGTNYTVPSVVFLGGASGWASQPDIQLPTEGASDVVVADMIRRGHGGYMSNPIKPGDPEKLGTFHTFRYSATIGSGESATVRIIDSETWEVLASSPLRPGDNAWVLAGLFRIRDHPAVRVLIDLDDPARNGDLSLDYVWLNWTPRMKMAPQVLRSELSTDTVLRMRGATMWVDIVDEWDATKDLVVSVQHQLEGTSDWLSDMVGQISFTDGRWTVQLQTDPDVASGNHSFRVRAVDREGMTSAWTETGSRLRVLNNAPTAPEVEIEPKEPRSTDELLVKIVRSARDFDGYRISYRYTWFKDGILMDGLVSDRVAAEHISKGDNWTVEVKAFDGEDESPVATAWALVLNSPPSLRGEISDITFDEDAVDTSLDLSGAAVDPDGDALVWTLKAPFEHMQVTIDRGTGVVTLRPEPNWYGELLLTFTTSDGEYGLETSVKVFVLSVNDLPRYVTVNGMPAIGTVQVTAREGVQLVVAVLVEDVEGDPLTFALNTTEMEFDATTGTVRWTPTNDDVGEHKLRMTVHDDISTEETIGLDLIVMVENVNNPPAEPRITTPLSGYKTKVNQTFNLSGKCTDPDEMHGQVLTYTWSSNASGLLGEGPRLTVMLNTPGVHIITLSVSDGEFQKTTTVSVTCEALPPVEPPKPPKPPKPEDEGPGFEVLAVVACLTALAALKTRRRKP